MRKVAAMSFRVLSSVVVSLSVLLAARSALAATCTLGEHAGIDDVEAKTASGIVCHELTIRAAPSASFEVRLGKLNGRTLVTVTEGGDESRQVRTFVSGLDELDVAGARLAVSVVDAKPLADTRDVDNVMAEEGRAPKRAASVVGAVVGTYVLSSLGVPSAPSGGIDVGLGFRTGRLGLTGDGRLGGIGSGATKMTSASLDVGGRFYLTNGDYTPFVGAGVGLSRFSRHADGGGVERSGSGASAFATLGFEALRSSHVGFLVAARVDLPFYELDPNDASPIDYYLRPPVMAKGSPVYAAPISLTLALSFH